MPLDRQFENDVYCPYCHDHLGEIWSATMNDTGIRQYFTKPTVLPKYCPRCEQVVERMYQ